MGVLDCFMLVRSEAPNLLTYLTMSTYNSTFAIAWCLSWGSDRHLPESRTRFYTQLKQGKPVESDFQPYLEQADRLQKLEKAGDFPITLQQLQTEQPDLWNDSTRIGLVYGGATKIKQYVFESNNLQDIRGASALLDRINLIDLKAFFNAESSHDAKQWLDRAFPTLSQALIPELVIYSTGGNILAFCPAQYADDLANAIERRYTEETLVANSCAVGDTFRLLELHFGLLPTVNQKPLWLEEYRQQAENPILQAYFAQAPQPNGLDQQFRDRKNFSELVSKLATEFNQRRGGAESPNRPSRRFPPLYETHPYLQREENDRRSAIVRVTELPQRPKLSEASARRRHLGQITKKEQQQTWWGNTHLQWQPGAVESWVSKFVKFLGNHPCSYFNSREVQRNQVKEARSLREIGSASSPKGFVAYIYADGNNMGQYIQKSIKTPKDYQRFSDDISNATKNAVYTALEKHLHPALIKRDTSENTDTPQNDSAWIHPFEILTIGGDDVFLVVPANQALDIAKTISEAFEQYLLKTDSQKYEVTDSADGSKTVHRYQSPEILEQPRDQQQCCLSMSVGVLITSEDTPIYYAEKLVSQLLKFAKQKAKALHKKGYLGGTVDFLVLKSVTMISSNIGEFRAQGLTRERTDQPKLKLYGAPYTLHEIGGLLATARALKAAKFPPSQLYQVRSLLEQGKRTAMLNYLYFRSRLKQSKLLEEQFEQCWCGAKTNGGNLAPWMSLNSESESQSVDHPKTTYETIWRELVDLMPFIEDPPVKARSSNKTQQSRGR